MSKNIPEDEGVGIIDTDFVSEPRSDMSDSDSDFWKDIEERQVKAGIVAKAWVTVGLAWRSLDVSECVNVQDDADRNPAVRRLSPVASLQSPPRRTSRPRN